MTGWLGRQRLSQGRRDRGDQHFGATEPKNEGPRVEPILTACDSVRQDAMSGASSHPKPVPKRHQALTHRQRNAKLTTKKQKEESQEPTLTAVSAMDAKSMGEELTTPEALYDSMNDQRQWRTLHCLTTRLRLQTTCDTGGAD
ncbi:hypothetical protein NDU88_004581 [Pleurodeles waltl]|uniref:Uncharacterized protein n=1 Tax=Pleurodeles waltl TaxID=8319 RepID=A0AAV7M6Q6_PLEWA|nr:hypothetical protein NDU88_004581 [Pleurodeles waltl]